MFVVIRSSRNGRSGRAIAETAKIFRWLSNMMSRGIDYRQLHSSSLSESMGGDWFELATAILIARFAPCVLRALVMLTAHWIWDDLTGDADKFLPHTRILRKQNCKTFYPTLKSVV